jgi:Alginate lyase
MRAGRPERPRTFTLDPAALLRTRRAASRDPDLEGAIAELIDEADGLLDARFPSVVEKSKLSPGGSRHDYMSLAPYWWPDPRSGDGLPYVRRDGELNPEVDAIPDKAALRRVLAGVWTLALAFFFGGRETHAAKAAGFLRVWFCDGRTAMAPHLEFAQAIPGVTAGRPQGLIDVRGFAELIDAVGLLAGSRSWQRDDERRIRWWFARYLDWLLGSEVGREEAAAANNHGTWYDVQAAAIARLAGRDDLARRTLERTCRRIDGQIAADGSQPEELARTRSWHYSVFNLDGLVRAAALGRSAGIDLWGYRSPRGAGIGAALDYLVPFASGERAWPHPEISGGRETDVVSGLLHQAAIAYRSAAYRDAAVALGVDKRTILLYGRVP